MIQTVNVSTEPTTAGSGISAPRIRTSNGARYGRGRSGSRIRSLITASCAAVNASRTPNEKRLARNETSWRKNEVAITIADDTIATEMIASGETCARRLRRPNDLGSCPCSPSENASRENPEIDVVTAASRISAPVRPT